MKVAVSGASGKTGFRIAEEALKCGHNVRLILRSESQIPDSIVHCQQNRLSTWDVESLDESLRGSEALIIATGARPSIDLTGPARVDALGVKRQVESCKRLGIKRVVLVSSLCAGRWRHPLNLFGLILVWKRLGEEALEESGLDWTVIRPGGLTEREDGLEREGIFYSSKNQQESASIPRRLVARCCVESLSTPKSIGQIIEVTSDSKRPLVTMEQALASFATEPS